MEDMRKDMGVSISYVKAWRAREHALELVRGSPEESYAILPSYCAMLEAKHPGMITHIETNSINHFMYFFHVTWTLHQRISHCYQASNCT